MKVTIHKHEAIPNCRSFEVRFGDGRPSVFFYFEDDLGRRLRPDLLNSTQALEAARTLEVEPVPPRRVKALGT